MTRSGGRAGETAGADVDRLPHRGPEPGGRVAGVAASEGGQRCC